MSNQQSRILNAQKALDEDMCSNLSEFALDSILDDGIFKDVPFMSTFFGVIKTYSNITDRILLKKILVFLNSLGEVSECDYNKMSQRLDNPKQLKIIGERLIFIINATNEIEKTQYLAKAFRAFIENRISRKELDRIWDVIDSCYMNDLKLYPDISDTSTASPIVGNITLFSLFTVSMLELVKQNSWNLNDTMHKEERYVKTGFGYKVSHILFDTPRTEHSWWSC